MKEKQIQSMQNEDAKSKLAELTKELVKLNSQVYAGGSIKNPAMIKNTKRTIARLKQKLKEE